ncbi:MAG: alpha/beta hydrolase [Candidatus Hydrogenedentota bacterium]
MKRWILKVVLIIFSLLVAGDVIFWQVWDRFNNGGEENPGITRAIQDTETQWMVSYLMESVSDPDLPRLIYVHGTPGDAGAFERYLLNPMEGYESISVDRPGFGQTSPKIPAYSLADHAAALEPFLVEQGGQWPILIGHSLGGPIIAQVAAQYPERVSGIVILAGSLDPDEEKWHWYNRLLDWKATAYLVPQGLRNSNRELKPMRSELEKLEPLLSQVECLVTILHAPDDMLVPYANVAYMERMFPEGSILETVILEEKNHFLPWNSEGEVRAAIVRMGEAMLEEED